jgi:hypothetical protein
MTLGVFVDEAAEPITPQDPDIDPGTDGSGVRILVDCPARPWVL